MNFSEEFAFSQLNIQSDGGWCNGLALLLSYILTHDGALPTSGEAFRLASDMCAALADGGKCDKGAVPKKPLPRGAYTLRGYANGPSLPNFSDRFVYNFSSPGIAMLQLNVTNSTTILVYGGSFQWRVGVSFLADVNHAGVVVWGSDTIFLFDPNVGGARFTYPKGWSISSVMRYSVPAAIDEALETMYRNSALDRNHKRRCRVVSAVHVDPKTFASDLRKRMQQDPNPSKWSLVGLASAMIETPDGRRRLESWMRDVEPSISALLTPGANV